eukprot:2130564-Amphidinium_carterae.1
MSYLNAGTTKSITSLWKVNLWPVLQPYALAGLAPVIHKFTITTNYVVQLTCNGTLEHFLFLGL